MSLRKSKNLLDIVPIYSPRTTYNQMKTHDQKMVEDITLNFDRTTIGLLRDQFQKKNRELTLDEFITLAKKHLKFWQPQLPDREKCLVKYLTRLFNQIDINGNGDMQWKQFTNYIIQKAMVLKNLKSKSQEIKRYVKSDVEPRLKIDGLIQKAQYINDIQKIAFFEEGASKIQFMDVHDGTVLTKTLQIDPKKLVISISSIKKTKGRKAEIKKKDFEIPTQVRVLDILYLSEKKYRILLVSTSDGFVRGWKYTQSGFILATQPDNEEEIFEHYFSSEIYCLSWDSVNEVLYCGQKSGGICIWNLKTDLQKALYENKSTYDQKQSNQKKINLIITCMITMPKLQFMASGRMDGKLMLWDTINNKKKWTYKEHTRGIMSLAFNQSMILLFSAGFDHKICVWNPYIETLIHKIEIHSSPILTLKVIESSNQLISLDSQGMVKITDTKRFNGIYSFSIQKQESNQLLTPGSNGQNLSGFIAIDDPLKLLFTGKTISIYEYDKNYNPLAADENFVVSIEYIEKICSFITASGNKIKVWSALNGDINKIFIGISEKEITAMTLDSLKRKIIIGDIDGNVTVHNVLNGAKIKQLSKHSTEILALITEKNDTKMLISCSIDNQIRIFKEVNDTYEIVRYIHFRQDIQITQLKFQTNINLVMVGTNVGTVGFYDTETGKNVGNCLTKNLDEITSLCPTQHSILITTTSSGKINLFAIPPSNTKFQKLLTFIHRDCEKNSGVGLGITASCYNQQDNLLFVIDDKMYFTCYDLSEINIYRAGIKQASCDIEKVSSLNKKMQKMRFQIKWQVKTNHETIKVVVFISEQNILCTTSYDKKVKLWNASTGQYIDSLQQNYNKSPPQPIAYYDTRKFILIAKSKKETVDQVKVDLPTLQSDPQQLQAFINSYDALRNEKSNKDWKLQVKINPKNVKKHQESSKIQKKSEPQELQLDNFQQKIFPSTSAQSMGKLRQQCFQKVKGSLANFQKLVSKQNMQSLHNQSYAQNSSQLFSANLTSAPVQASLSQTENNFYCKKGEKRPMKRSMMKCIQNCQERKSHTDLMFRGQKEKRLINSQINKSKDYIPIYQVLGLKEKKNAANEHRNLIEHLYKTQTQSIINSRQQQPIYMGNQEAKATRKLCELLLKIDETDKRPKNLLKNIKIKQNLSQSMHSTLSKALPKI